MKIAILYSRLFQSTLYIPKRINHKFLKKILYENNYYPIAIVYLKYLFFHIKNCSLKIFLSKMVSFEIFKDQIWSKYTPKRTKLYHLKKFLGGVTPRTPLANRMAQHCICASWHANFQIWKKFLGPPPYQILGTPLALAPVDNVADSKSL